MTKRPSRRPALGKVARDIWKKWWPHLVVAILGGLVAMLIHWIVTKVFPVMRPFWPVLLAFTGGFLVATVAWFVAATRHPNVRKRMLSRFALALTTVSISASILVAVIIMDDVLKEWHFEDGTAQGWGVYDGEGRVLQNRNVVARSGEYAHGEWSLRVDNINLTADSQKPDVQAFKAWVAVRCKGNLDLTNAKLTASIYVPVQQDLDYADVRFFLFLPVAHDPNDKEWRQSGTADGGTLLEPGKWVDLVWDLRSEQTRQWASPWPWRNILGMQIYVEGTFRGPVYIDNVTITTPK